MIPPHLGEPDPLIGIRAEHRILRYRKLQPQYICLARLKIQLGENLPSAPFFADDKEVRQLDTLRRTVQFWADLLSAILRRAGTCSILSRLHFQGKPLYPKAPKAFARLQTDV